MKAVILNPPGEALVSNVPEPRPDTEKLLLRVRSLLDETPEVLRN
jgi:hypothetical protein